MADFINFHQKLNVSSNGANFVNVVIILSKTVSWRELSWYYFVVYDIFAGYEQVGCNIVAVFG